MMFCFLTFGNQNKKNQEWALDREWDEAHLLETIFRVQCFVVQLRMCLGFVAPFWGFRLLRFPHACPRISSAQGHQLPHFPLSSNDSVKATEIGNRFDSLAFAFRNCLIH